MPGVFIIYTSLKLLTTKNNRKYYNKLLTYIICIAKITIIIIPFTKLKSRITTRSTATCMHISTIWIPPVSALIIAAPAIIALTITVIGIWSPAIIPAFIDISATPAAYRNRSKTHPIITAFPAWTFRRATGGVISRAIFSAGRWADIFTLCRTSFGGISIIAGLRIETKIFAGIKRTFNAAVRTFIGSIYVSHCFTIRRLGAGRYGITGSKSGAA